MDDTVSKIAKVLNEAAETHHQVYRIVEGADDDWASWYSEWLITLSALPDVLGVKPVPSELTYLLVKLDKEYAQRQHDLRWEDFYAVELLRHFGAG